MARSYTHIKQYYEEMEQMHQEGHSCREIGEKFGFTKEQAQEQFGFLLNAFKYGVPPHAGLAYGLDRLVMLMAKEDSIRDVMAFPKIKDASCLMTQAPSMADNKQLEELGLKLDIQEDQLFWDIFKEVDHLFLKIVF